MQLRANNDNYRRSAEDDVLHFKLISHLDERKEGFITRLGLSQPGGD